jgi:O-antigen/teichoic acid export membrane protein
MTSRHGWHVAADLRRRRLLPADLALEHLASPQDVAIYYAAARLLAVVAFVYYAISGTTMHKFTQYYVAGDLVRLQQFFAETARWTFWPSLALCGGILVLGKPLLALFGVGLEAGYNAMLILAFGMLARAAVGPAERMLNMLGDRKPCALIYALAFTLNPRSASRLFRISASKGRRWRHRRR